MKHQLYFGNFYFFDNFIVAEMHKGVFFDWKKATIVIELAEAFYGENSIPHYISNRKNKYFVNPADWTNFFQLGYKIKSYIVIHKTKSSLFNFKFEKMFFKGKTLQFYNLHNAVTWINSFELQE
ncbi:MAG TPA: hypothetical protein EYO36_01955 [Mesonia sp.]|nr:hypothetical protein [Mesonia sp.]